jgi:hypothetical protein
MIGINSPFTSLIACRRIISKTKAFSFYAATFNLEKLTSNGKEFRELLERFNSLIRFFKPYDEKG